MNETVIVVIGLLLYKGLDYLSVQYKPSDPFYSNLLKQWYNAPESETK